MSGLRKEIERFYDHFTEPMSVDMATLGPWEPRLDVSETREAVVIKAELPGVDPNDIALSLENGVLALTGEKAEEKEDEDKRYHRVERSYGAFARAVRLPAAVDPSKVTAMFKDGVLTVTLPKAAEAKGTTIPIKAA